jgi:hypothetical protein
MARAIKINHVTLIVDNLEKAGEFYEKEMGLEPLPAFRFDYPVMFFKFNEEQQLHISEWEDTTSFRGHICVQVDDFNTIFMQMFVRDPSGNLVEISSQPGSPVDKAIFEDELYEAGLYVSNRNDFRGYKADNATLYHK